VVHRIRPLSARAADGADVRERLAAVDRQYHPLQRLEESLDLDFELPVLAAGAARSVFLWSNGYYSVHPPLQGHHSARTVQALQREPGALGRFSRELAVEYQRRWVHTPRVAEARP
jgi:hypothetical protein